MLDLTTKQYTRVKSNARAYNIFLARRPRPHIDENDDYEKFQIKLILPAKTVRVQY